MLIQANAFGLPYPDKLFHACVTSPPYWGLRKYQGDQGEEPLGLESTPERHIERMVEVFREVRRVLRDDGVCWLNYGDCFAAHGRYDAKYEAAHPERGAPSASNSGKYGDDYVLRKSSWRHTRAHEYVFQLVKGMGYYCNQEAVREAHKDYDKVQKEIERQNKRRRDGHNLKKGIGTSKDYVLGWDEQPQGANPSGRNPRSVLDVPTAPYKGAHYATFPPKLIAPLIRASVPRRCCPECGMAWAPVVEKQGRIRIRDGSDKSGASAIEAGLGKTLGPSSIFHTGEKDIVSVTDYRPTCECGVTEHKPGIVLDIFGGSGTTGMVAKQLMRRWVVMDISRPYLDEQAKVRTGTGTPSKALEGLPMFEEEDDE